MHVINTLHELVHVILYHIFTQIVRPAFDQLVDIAFHEFKDERESACRLIIDNFMQFDYVSVRRQAAQCLDLAERIHLVDILKDMLHALYRHEVT